MKEEKKENVIETYVAVFMITVAVIFDVIAFLLNFIPILGTLAASCSNIVAWLTFFVWFKIKGVDFSKGKNAITNLAGGLIEMIPVVNALPAWTFSVSLLCAFNSALGGKIMKVAEKITGKRSSEQNNTEKINENVPEPA